MAKDINQAVREVCLSFPEAEEVVSHGSPNFRVRGKTFAMYVVNHHGDGRVALWLSSPPGAQALYAHKSARHFFVPPYVGPKGWLGVHLNKGLSWNRVAQLVREAYEKVAPKPLAAKIGDTIEIKPPTQSLTAEQIDPLQSRRAKTVLKTARKIFGSWPEVTEGVQFGSPVWKAGKKSFASAHVDKTTQRLQLLFWTGLDRQSMFTLDERYTIPMYMGHNGWIALDVTEICNPEEIRELALASFRHFATKRMLTAFG
jgi:predicted DNA-binding protein (MmcQ/YjbR family)